MFDDREPPTVLDALVAPADVAAWATIASPGPDAVAPLAVIDPARIDGAARNDLLVGLERQIAWLQACQQRVLAALDGEALSWAGAESIDFTQEQVGAALRLSPGTAANRLAVARVLTDRLPATVERLARGEITYLQARKLAEAVTPFDDGTCGVIEEKVLRRAGEQTLSQFSATLRRLVLSADPRRAEQRHADALAERRVVITPADDGMAQLWALLPAEGAALIGCVLDALAVKTPGQTRTADQRRADALIDVFARVIADPKLPEQQDMRPSVQVTRRSIDPSRRRQPTRRADRLRTDHCRACAAHRGRSERHLAATTHRPRHRRPTRLRPHHLPPTPRPGRLRHRPRPHLRVPHLSPRRTPLRPRPPPSLARRRHHLPTQPAPALSPPPPRQTPSRVGCHPPTGRQLPLDQPYRPPLHRAARALPARRLAEPPRHWHLHWSRELSSIAATATRRAQSRRQARPR
jgi:hypothetical protein